jgi:hypothetical protein
MPSTLIDSGETRFDAMNGVRSGMEIRIPNHPAPPPTTPSNSSIRTSSRKRHVSKSPRDISKLTDSHHESFGWLEEYVDVKYEEMMKRGDSSSLGSHTLNLSGQNESPLSPRDTPSLELKELPHGKSHHRTCSRRDSILGGVDEDGEAIETVFFAHISSNSSDDVLFKL